MTDFDSLHPGDSCTGEPSKKETTPVTASPNYLYLPPRIGIIHLVALMTIFALLLSLNKTIELIIIKQKQIIIKPSHLSIWTGIYCIEMCLLSAGFVCSGILLNAKRHHEPGLFQPGHWLVLMRVAAVLIDLFSSVHLVIFSQGSFVSSLWWVLFTGIHIALAIAIFWIAKHLPGYGCWRFFFRLWAIATVYPALLALLVWLNSKIYLWMHIDTSFLTYTIQYWSISFVLVAFAFLTLITCVVWDIKRGQRHDWVHWIGIGIVGWDLLNKIIVTIILRIL